jgi:hypothetical protein
VAGSLRNVRELIPTAGFSAGRSLDGTTKLALENDYSDWPETRMRGPDNSQSLESLLAESSTDSMAVLHKGKKSLSILPMDKRYPLCD